ncbi:MAG TPA: hypothetical protein DDZ81_00505 [Acetobacteraceae bacterium]|jgi:hypothetical protein|nr:hypothetical protein [Acetobacteraceae bacterium]
MNDDPLDLIPSFARISVAAVLVSDGEDPGSALTEAGIIDPIAVEVRIGDTVDLSEGLFGDGATPNLTAILETEQGGDECDGPSQHQAASGFPRDSARSMAGDPFRPEPVATNLPPAFGMRPVAPVRGSVARGRIPNGESALLPKFNPIKR